MYNLSDRVARLSNFELKKELRLAITNRDVAELHKNADKLAYWQSYFEALAGEAGSRGVDLVQESKPYKLDAAALKSRVDLAEYIGDVLELRRCGLNRVSGLCPFHNDSFPSLFVYVDRQDWYCFGCCRGGDIYSFIEYYRGVDFYDALTILNREVSDGYVGSTSGRVAAVSG